MKTIVNLIFFSFLIAGIYVFYLEPKFKKVSLPDTSNAAAYQFVSTEDFSFPGRKRISFVVATNAFSPEIIKQTATKAAIDFRESSHADVVRIFLVRNSGEQEGLGAMSYAADGKGNSGDQKWTWDWLFFDAAP